MSESKEEIDLLSEKELEDGEIEDGELDEPELKTTIVIEPEPIVTIDNYGGSDVDFDDKTFLKNKKHKHHKKGFHRKRHNTSEETSDNVWKKIRNSNDEFDDYQTDISGPVINNININNIMDSEIGPSENRFNDNPQHFKSKSDHEFREWRKSDSFDKWGDYESDEDDKNISKIGHKQNFSSEIINKHSEVVLSPVYEPSSIDNNIEQHEVSKWNYDSEDETESSTFNKDNVERKTFDECNVNDNNKWYSNNNNNKDWNDFSYQNKDDLNLPKNLTTDMQDLKDNSPIVKTGWGSYDSPCDDNDDVYKKPELPDSPQKTINESFGKWSSYESPEKATDENPKWDSNQINDNDHDHEWNTRRNDDGSQKWSSRDSPRRNDDDSQRWGSRDGYRRNNFRRWGSRDGLRRNNNNNFRRWGSRNGPQRGNNQRWGSFSNNNNDNKPWDSSNKDSSQYNNDNKRWESNNGSPQNINENENSSWSPQALSTTQVNDNQDIEAPEKAKWGVYDSDDNQDQLTTSNDPINETDGTTSFGFEVNPDKNRWESQSNTKKDDDVEPGSGFNKWGCFDSDEEEASIKRNTSSMDNANSSKWKSFNNDGEGRSDSFFEARNPSNYNNNCSWNRNDMDDFQNERNDFKNDKSKRWANRNDGDKRSVCKYFSMGSCRHGDRCTFLHSSPPKPVNQENKKKELCKFYEHQQCYKRTNCIYLHEEFPCKLFHAGSKMCPSGDSCKYSHAPLNQETKTLLEKYLDEKVDERIDKNSSEWSSIIKKAAEEDIDEDGPVGFDQPDGMLSDPLGYRYSGVQDLMRFPVRPWNAMMRYNMSMQVPHQMDFMHRQRFLCQYPMNTGRMFPRGFRSMVPSNLHEGFSKGMPIYSMPTMTGANQKLHSGNLSDLNDNFIVSDPYIDNLAQLVVSRDSTGSPKRLVDMLDPNLQCEDIDDFSLEIETNNSKTNLSSPVVLKSPEIPPGAYVPRTSMNMVQPNVRLGPGPGFGEQPMLYGGYPGHPNETAMMDYINLSAIHYFHNHGDHIGYDFPWKLLLLEVPVKVPYPLMVIETQDLPHKYTDPRLKGHPSVFNSNNTNNNFNKSITQSYDFNSISTFGSQLSSPNLGTGNSETSDTLTPINDFLSRSDDPESPLFSIGEDLFNFKQKIESHQTSDRSYLQDPRFKRKKVNVNSTVIEQSGMME